MADQVERKLTAILAADVAGYSRLMAADEEGTLARLKSHRRELIDPKIREHRGRIIKTTGDGLLIEFASVVDAVRCAVDVQRGMATANADVPPDRRIEFRAGINIGDVIVDGDDIYGDGVNIAARLENIADPGGIRVSANVRDQVLDKLGFGFDDLGEQSLKNIARPVRVYAVQTGEGTAPAPVGVALAAAPHRAALRAASPPPAGGGRLGGGPIVGAALAVIVIVAVAAWYFLAGPGSKVTVANAPAHLSIVVLPFANLSNDPKQDYFADGITENLTTDLSRIRNSFVIARNTAFTYKGKAVDAKEIGKELGVRYVLEGSVQRDGNRVRVNAQLIDAESGSHLWADRFEEDLADLFKLQDDVVARLANTLGYELVKAEAAKDAHSTNPDAIDLALQGWASYWRDLGATDRGASDKVEALFERALRIDPDNDDALAGLAYMYFRQFFYGWGAASIDFDAEILTRADRAIAVNPGNAKAYYVKSIYLAESKQPDRALVAAGAGLNIDPNSAPLYFARALSEVAIGRYGEARSDLAQAMKLSPRDPQTGVWNILLGGVEIAVGHDEAAVEDERKGLQTGYGAYLPHAYLASAYALMGKSADAATELAEARRINPKLTVKWAMAHTIDGPRFYEGLRKAGLPEDAAPPPPKHLSIVVLPFTNLSGDPKQDYFADGITDNLTTDLSRIRNSFVIARNTAFTFKGKNVDAKEIGKELGVRYVLEGSVQRDGNRVRVNAQLIDAEKGDHLWADRFEDDLADLFKLQDDVVARLANALGYELTKAEAAKAAHSTNPDAIDLAMQGWAILNRPAANYSKDGAARALSIFDRALNQDPQNVDALVGAALAERNDYSNKSNGAEKTEEKSRIEGRLDTAIKIDPNNARAFVVRGMVYAVTKRTKDAAESARVAVNLNPNYAAAYAQLAQDQLKPDEWSTGIANVERALKLSPRDQEIGRWHWLKCQRLLWIGKYPEAIVEGHAAIDSGFATWPAYGFLAAAYAMNGQPSEAEFYMKLTRKAGPQVTIKWLQARVDDPEETYVALRKAGLPEDDGPRLSIVVLPFQNLSGDSKQDYLADVLTDELTTYISRIPGSFVIARNTAFTYKGKPTDVKTIGKDLGVRYALEGSVQPTDKRIRTNAQLIDTETGAHLWAEQFDTDKADLLQAEDDIVTRLARTLDVALTEVEAAKGARVRPDNPDAQDLALKCLANVYGLSDYDPKKLAALYEPCEEASQIDPRNVLARSLLAFRHANAVSGGRSRDPAADIRAGNELAARALEIDPNDSLAHAGKALLLLDQGRMDESIVEAERAIALNPSNMTAYVLLCAADNAGGYHDKAFECADKAARLSPHDPYLAQFFFNKYFALTAMQKNAESVVWLDRAMALAPNLPIFWLCRASVLARYGSEKDAREAFRRYLSFPGAQLRTIAQVKAYQAYTYPATDPISVGDRARFQEGLRKAGMPEQ